MDTFLIKIVTFYKHMVSLDTFRIQVTQLTKLIYLELN